MKPLFLVLCVAQAAFAVQAPTETVQGIPRVSTRHFVREGLYEGGDAVRANLEGLRFAQHPGGIERWVVDFSDAAGREIGKAAPRFRLRYEPAEPGKRREPRFVLNLRTVQNVKLTPEMLKQLPKKSKFVKEVVLYPPVEDGDISLELVLHSSVRFETHQPLEKAGRLVLDLMRSP